MQLPYQRHAIVAANRVISFRRKWANKSDRTINAALNYFWDKHVNRHAPASEKDKEKRLN